MPIAFTKLEPAYKALNAGQLEQAHALALRLVQAHPQAPEAAGLMRLVCMAKQQMPQAVFYARRLADLAPTDPHARADLGETLIHAGHTDEGVAIFEALLASHAHEAAMGVRYATLLLQMRRAADAERVCRASLEAHPHERGLWSCLSSSLLEQGRAGDAVEIMQRLVRQRDDSLEVVAHLASAITYEQPLDKARWFAAHQNFGRLLQMSDFQEPFKHPRRPAGSAPRTGPLNVGFVSSDFKRHSVAFFVEPLFRHLDRARVRPHGIMTSFFGDRVTEHLRTLCTQGGGGGGGGGKWHNIAVMQPAQGAAYLKSLNLDVLIDLNGLTFGHRLPTLRLKPAPVQMTFCGYPGTTGLPAIDFRIVDSITDPPGSEAFMTERPLHLDPCFLCYQPPADAPEPAPGPSARGEAFTFGSFNMILKVNDAVVNAWSTILKRVPESRLLIKSLAFDSEAMREETASRLVARGIARERIEALKPVPGTGGHLSTYARVDVALDTFPYTGTTTTCEALFMGVPVVTLCPPPERSLHAGRVSASLLRCVGEAGLIAPSEERYIDLAASLAADPAELARLRGSLRGSLRSSPLCDGPGYCRRFEDLVWEGWRAVMEPGGGATGSARA